MLGLGGHVVLHFNEDLIEEIKCNGRVSNQLIYGWKFLVETRVKD